jgi:hypothetical protein
MYFSSKPCVVFLLLLLVCAPARAQKPTPNERADSAEDSVKRSVISNIDLSGPFKTRTAWHFIATQGPPVAGVSPSSGEDEPGQIQLCLGGALSPSCDPQLQTRLRSASFADDPFAQPHYLDAVKIVYPRGPADHPLLFVQTRSVFSGDGDRVVLTQVLAYESSKNRFVRIYQSAIGGNRNEEVRYISSGRLKGDIISVEPTENAPYGYWVTVNALTTQYAYKKVLRYRSATRYGDNNPLAVIDSEMPNIEQRLGYWKSGMALPLPSGACPRPRLIRMELWCN